MNSSFGSEWRKWDFHVHTPYSVLNNQFGLNANDSADFDSYVQTLFAKAIEKDIWAIGITDYFSIDGYKRIRNDYLDKPDKLAELFPDDELRRRIEQILVFPNIEFRLDRFVDKGDKSKPIGYHVLFSDEVDCREIEDNFLHKLRCAPDHCQSWTLTHHNIEQLGDLVRSQNGGKGDSYALGLSNVSIDEDDVLNALGECRTFDGRSLIAIPVDEALSKADWNRSYFPKKALYGQCHCYMTSNGNTRDWALDEDRIPEFGSLKPCIWGSDAHSFDRLFEPVEHRYCWIKADPTFEGLMQILCEPADRIAIQEDRPEPHNNHRSIESVRFNDKRFQKEPIFFNEGLTCIIGGRSTGKSLLLRQVARSISPDYAIEQEERSSLSTLDGFKPVDVFWRDGAQSGERKIIYLPQTYLNRTVDDPESGETGASALIAGVLLQNEQIGDAYERFCESRKKVAHAFSDDYDAYVDVQVQLDTARKSLIAHGEPSIYREGEKKLAEEYRGLLGPGNASEEDMRIYSELKKLSEDEANIAEAMRRDRSILGALPVPVLPEPVFNGAGCYDALTSESALELRKEMEFINEVLGRSWTEAVGRLSASCAKRQKAQEEKSAETARRLAELGPKIERSDKLYRAMSALNEERKKLATAEKIDAGIRSLQMNRSKLFDSVSSARGRFYKVCEAYSKEVEPLSASMAEGLDFSAEVVWRKKDFEGSVINMLDRRRFGMFEKATGRDLLNLSDADYCDELLMDIWRSVSGELDGCQLQLKNEITEGDFFRKLFGDWYDIHYVVTSGGDRLDKMSPGKKGLVLLELIVELEQGDCPILIDQPEDDLDNQSIYSELRRFIKDSKKRRQIIIVTHNANIALGADAEEIIVANQEGQGRENAGCKFEYRSGSIENNAVPEGDTTGLPFLDRYSIQQHACQILDGGKEALEQRRRKYSMGK